MRVNKLPNNNTLKRLFKSLKSNNLYDKIKATNLIIKKGQIGIDYTNNCLKKSTIEEKYDLILNLMEGGYFYKLIDGFDTTVAVINQLKDEVFKSLFQELLKRFKKHWKNSSCDFGYLFDNYLFNTMALFIEIGHPLAEESFKKELDYLITNDNGLLSLDLFFKGLLTFLSKRELRSTFERYSPQTLIEPFFRFTIKEHNIEYFDWMVQEIEKLGHFGKKFLILLINKDYDYDYDIKETISESLIKLYEKKQNTHKDELIELFLKSNLKQLRELLDLEVSCLLDKDDLQIILKSTTSHFLEKLEVLTDEFHPPTYFEDILIKIGKKGADLVFKLAQKRDCISTIRFAMMEMKHEMIESFITNVIFNNNNYEYGDWAYDLVEIFFEVFNKKEIKSIVNSKEYDIIERIKERHHQSNGILYGWFFIFQVYKTLDIKDTKKIYDIIPDAYNDEIIRTFQEGGGRKAYSQKEQEIWELLESRIKSIRINEYITLKYEYKVQKAYIYVKNKFFRQFNSTISNIHFKENEGEREIVKFWELYSNLRKWVEDNYDKSLLNFSIAIPLLKELINAGDLKAKEVLNAEIKKQFLNDDSDAITLLLFNDYLDYLPKKDLDYLLDAFNPKPILNMSDRNKFDHLRKLMDYGSKKAEIMLNQKIKDYILNNRPEMDNHIKDELLEKLDEERTHEVIKSLDVLKKFKITNLFVLKLEEVNGILRTIIYVGGKRFIHCKALLLVNPNEMLSEEIDSIDKAVELMKQRLQGSRISAKDLGLTPEQEFIGHCSNLQAWYEHGYDTRLLHYNLAFPLLKRLKEAGDVQASKAYKEELAKRVGLNHFPSFLFLYYNGHLDDLSEQEMDDLFTKQEKALRELLAIIHWEGREEEIFGYLEDLSISEIINEYSMETDEELEYNRRKDLRMGIHNSEKEWRKSDPWIAHEGEKITKLTIRYIELPPVLPDCILRLKDLEELCLNYAGVCEIPDNITDLSKLKVLDLDGNHLEESSVSALTMLIELGTLERLSFRVFGISKKSIDQLKELDIQLEV